MVFYSGEELKVYDQWYTSWSDPNSGTISKKTMTDILRSTYLPDMLLAEVLFERNKVSLWFLCYEDGQC
jgi:hypothetical protein